MVMQFSVSGREERRGLLTLEAVAAADLSERKSQGRWVSKERRVGVGQGGWTVSRVPVKSGREPPLCLFSALAVMAWNVMAYTDVPPGGALRLLMRNRMVCDAEYDLVIVAPADQRNVAFSMNLEVSSEPVVVFSDLCQTGKAVSDACPCPHK